MEILHYGCEKPSHTVGSWITAYCELNWSLLSSWSTKYKYNY